MVKMSVVCFWNDFLWNGFPLLTLGLLYCSNYACGIVLSPYKHGLCYEFVVDTKLLWLFMAIFAVWNSELVMLFSHSRTSN